MSKRRITLIIISVLLWIAVAATPIFVMPVFDEMFADFGAKLPFLTAVLVSFAAVAKIHFYLYFQLVSGSLVVATSVVIETGDRLVALAFFVTALGATLLLIGVLSLPIIQLSEVAGGLQ